MTSNPLNLTRAGTGDGVSQRPGPEAVLLTDACAIPTIPGTESKVGPVGAMAVSRHCHGLNLDSARLLRQLMGLHTPKVRLRPIRPVRPGGGGDETQPSIGFNADGDAGGAHDHRLPGWRPPLDRAGDRR
eukprot:CAMPEP_0119408664 /NCGR_PEP_ID=MMETSP1335-20130426/2157_1 /TAXON_ID=259385 /ORGANISM="Chrysoculter rhomboideus, Strain RCC1486" /LENGTH=129 /DNA_ID=CAMNT_0007432937 /DNA_START=79 /DNA_END=469 /DNA_ORIENTATION=+